MKTSFLAIATAALFNASAQAQSFELTSPDVAAGSTIAAPYIFNGFGCTGGNLSPELNWRNAPAGIKSFAVMLHDQVAPTGGAGFWHWVAINLPATTTSLPRGAGAADGKNLPASARQINTDFGTPGYGGPCPPHAFHKACSQSAG
ncbi:MAG: YbhB/YbcL family Raf kinase inhibitor-like protein [Brachymonas sp.]